MRIPDNKIRAVAEVIRPRLFGLIARDAMVTPQDVRAAVVAARRAGEDVPNIGSARSLGICLDALCELG